MDNPIDRVNVPQSDMKKLTAAGVMLMVPIAALLWVGTYAQLEPVLLGFPFFIWYQFLWVFLCSLCTWTAYRLIQSARPRRTMPGQCDNRKKGSR